MDIYIDILRTLSTSRQLLDEYIKLCKKYSNFKSKKEAETKLGLLVEAHHFLPKSFNLGGEKDKANIVYLPLVEHRLAHKLLKDMFEGKKRQKMAFAYSRLIHRHGVKDEIPTSEYQSIRAEVGKLVGILNSTREYTVEYKTNMSIIKKNTKWVNNGMKEFMIGKAAEIPDGFIAGRMSNPIKGRIWINDGYENKMIAAEEPVPDGWVRGIYKSTATKLKEKSKPERTQTEEHKQKVSLAKKSAPHVTCPHCGKTAYVGPMKRFHFDNCKFKS